MPAFRSFLALSVLAACLAQVSAGGDGGSGGFGGFGGSGGSGGGNQGGQYGGGQGGNQGGGGSWGGQGQGGQGQGQGGGSWGGNNYNTQYNSWQAPPNTQVAAQTCPPAPPPYTQTQTETTTVTAVSPCTGSTVTAYVTQWQNAPPGCWCGPPPTGLPLGGFGSGSGGAVAAPIFTATVSITPGLSSIPAAEAVKTGVTVAGPAPAPAPTANVSPGGFFGQPGASAAASSAY